MTEWKINTKWKKFIVILMITHTATIAILSIIFLVISILSILIV